LIKSSLQFHFHRVKIFNLSIYLFPIVAGARITEDAAFGDGATIATVAAKSDVSPNRVGRSMEDFGDRGGESARDVDCQGL